MGDYEVPLSDVGDAGSLRASRLAMLSFTSPYGQDVAPEQRRQPALVRGGKHGRPVRLGQHVLDHEVFTSTYLSVGTTFLNGTSAVSSARLKTARRELTGVCV